MPKSEIKKDLGQALRKVIFSSDGKITFLIRESALFVREGIIT